MIYLLWGISQSCIKNILRSITPSSFQLTCSIFPSPFCSSLISLLAGNRLVSALAFCFFCTHEKTHVHFPVPSSFSPEGEHTLVTLALRFFHLTVYLRPHSPDANCSLMILFFLFIHTNGSLYKPDKSFSRHRQDIMFWGILSLSWWNWKILDI